jgi:hypothetical protein
MRCYRGLWCLLIGVSVALGGGCAGPTAKEQSPDQVVRANAQKQLRAQMSQPLNASSPLALDEVLPLLQTGLSLDDYSTSFMARVMAKGVDTGPFETGGPFVELQPPEAWEHKRQTTEYLKDANLTVIDDLESKTIVAWKVEPLKAGQVRRMRDAVAGMASPPEPRPAKRFNDLAPLRLKEVLPLLSPGLT